MDCLLIIDMQEDYVGEIRNRKRYPYNTIELIENINSRINSYPKEAVLYITNKFFWEISSKSKDLVKGLSIVNNNIFEKRKSNCFTNKKLLKYLEGIGADNIELAGIDGNYCVGSSALGGVRNGFTIRCSQSCIGIGNKEKFAKVKEKLKKANVQLYN